MRAYEQTMAAQPERLARTRERGTSDRIVDAVALDAPWATEKCNRCGTFHHAFRPSGQDTGAREHCGSCGETLGDISHGSPCKEAP